MTESIHNGLLSAGAALIAYLSFEYGKNIPFRYITQAEYTTCEWMNGTFCSRMSDFVMILLIYYVYIQAFTFSSLPIKNALQDPPRNAISGVCIGAGSAFISVVLNLLFGFIELRGIDYMKLLYVPIILIGMMFTGITEELLFRALPINALLPYVSESVLVIGTALLFGFVHMRYSLYYGFSAFIAGLLLGYGFLAHGLFWAAGFHTAYNTVETTFYSTTKYKVVSPFMAGERKTPDDDGLTTSLVETIIFCLLKYVGYL